MLSLRPQNSGSALEGGPELWLGSALVWFLYFVFLVLLVFGALFPDSFLWGIHIAAFLPLPFRFGLMILLLALPVFSRKYFPYMLKVVPYSARLRAPHYIALCAVAVLGSLVFYSARISTNMYGDTRTLLLILAGKKYTLADVIGWHDFEPLTRYIHQGISFLTGLDQREVYEIASAVMGGFFILLAGWFGLTVDGSPLWKLFILFAAFFAGVNQLFFGYVEDYTPVYLCMFAFLILAWKFFDGKNTLLWMILIFIVGIKLHVEMVLFAPALLYALLTRCGERYNVLKRWYRPGALVAGILVSIGIMAVVYIFVFHAYKFETGDNPEKARKIFLPIFNNLREPHGYTLFSLSHFSDIIQEILLAVSPGILIVIVFSLVNWRFSGWSSPRVVFYTLAVFYFMLFDFTVDPLLTPMRDWDMLALIAPSLTFLGIALAKPWFQSPHPQAHTLLGVTMGLALIPLAFFYVNSNEALAADRLRNLGVWGFKSYYSGSAYMVNVGCSLIPDRQQEIAERERIIKQLEPHASKPDFELGFLEYKLGAALLSNRECERAISYFGKALEQDAYNASAVKGLAESLLFTRNFEAAAREIAPLNEGINAAGVNDFEALEVAQVAYFGVYLQSRQASSVVVDNFLEKARPLLIH